MQKLRKAKIEDLEGIKRLCRRVDACLLEEGDDSFDSGYPNDEILQKGIDSETLIIIKEGKDVIGAFLYSYSLYDSFYPKSLDSRKIEEIYELSRVKEEMLIVIDFFLVDPRFFKEGIAYQLLNYLFSSHKIASYFIAIPTSNIRACKFFYRYGFSTIKLVDDLENWNHKPSYLMAKRYRKIGLASLEF